MSKSSLFACSHVPVSLQVKLKSVLVEFDSLQCIQILNGFDRDEDDGRKECMEAVGSNCSIVK